MSGLSVMVKHNYSMLFETKDDGEMCFDFTYYFIFVFAFLINYFFVSENTYTCINCKQFLSPSPVSQD